jgi:pyridoxamine 5'-phosphate oxidase
MAADVEHEDPIAWFEQAFARATEGESFDPTRAALATVDAQGRPAVRFVLVRRVSAEGFCFFTNYGSAKARHLDASPHAALAFHWASIDMQVRVEGAVERLDAQGSDSYFASRPRGNQIAAWASDQSRPVESRDALDARFAEAQARFEGRDVPRPDFWGGYRVVPRRIEFWISRSDRLHDRWQYTLEGGRWHVQRLQP